jgi:hypothetical protein
MVNYSLVEAINNIIIGIWEYMDEYKCKSTIAIEITT